MTSKFKIITTGIFLTIVTVFIFLMYRIDIIEKDFIKSATDIAGDISLAYKKFAEEPKKTGVPDLPGLLNSLNKKYPGVAYLAVTDMNYTLKLASKNDKFIKSGELNNTIMEDIAGRKLSAQGDRPYISRYYESKINKKNDEQKYYIFNKIVGNDRIILFFPYTPRNKVIIRICLEISLIILSYVIFTAAIYLISRKQTAGDTGGVPAANPNQQDQAVSTKISLNPEGNSIEAGDKKISGAISNLASDTLNSHVLKLFTQLKTKHPFEIMSLYLKNSENRLAKSFEYKGKAFIKIDSATFDTIDLDSSIGNELKKSAVIFMDSNRKVIVPIFHDVSLIGVLSLTKESPFIGNEIDWIKTELLQVTGHLSEYLVMNRVMIDGNCGLYSKAYFQLKFNEQTGHTGVFSVIFISLFSPETAVAPKERYSIIKLLSPAIATLLKNNSYLCSYDEYLGVILPDTTASETEEISVNLKKMLSKYRIKVDKNLTIQILPVIGASTSDASRKDDVITSALHNLK